MSKREVQKIKSLNAKDFRILGRVGLLVGKTAGL